MQLHIAEAALSQDQVQLWEREGEIGDVFAAPFFRTWG